MRDSCSFDVSNVRTDNGRIGRAGAVVGFCFLLLISASCARFENGSMPSPDHRKRQPLALLSEWQIKGRVGVRSAEESWQATLVWNHEEAVDHLYLSGPFGQGALNIKVSDHFIRVASSDGRVEESTQPVETLEATIGVTVPIQALRYWVLGLAFPEQPSDSKYDRQGNRSILDQLDWKVQYQGYQDVQNWLVPKKISLEHQSTRVKLVIDEWSFSRNG